MYYSRTFLYVSFIIVLLYSATQSVFAANPAGPILPSDNIQDPGDPSTPWGGCLPSDSNCYVTNPTTSATNGLSLISGAIGLGGLLTQNTDIDLAGNNLSFSGSGNVGVGTNTPNYTLDVLGMFNQTTTLPDGRTTSVHSGDNVIGAGVKGVGFTSEKSNRLSYLFAGDSTATGGAQDQAGFGIVDFGGGDATINAMFNGTNYAINLSTSGATGSAGSFYSDLGTYSLNTYNLVADSNFTFSPNNLDITFAGFQRFLLKSDGSLTLGAYPNTRDDSGVILPVNFLYTDIFGSIRSAPTSALSSNLWSLTGNGNTDPNVNFLGTTDLQDLIFKTNNMERVRILSNGNIGISTLNPLATLQVTGISGSNNNITSFVQPGAATGTDLVDGFPAIASMHTLDNSIFSLSYINDGQGRIANWQNTGNGLEFNFFNTSGTYTGQNALLPYGGYAMNNTPYYAEGIGMWKNINTINFGYVNYADINLNIPTMTIDQGLQYVGIGNTAPGYLLHVGSASTPSGTSVAQFENAGGTCTITPDIAGGITCTSDVNFKKNIEDLPDVSILEKLLSVDVKEYNMLQDRVGTQKQIGFIAQNLETIFPSLVVTDALGHKSVSYGAMTPILTQALREIDLHLTTSTPVEINGELTFAGRFFARLSEWLGDMNNSIESIFAKNIKTENLCVVDESGSETCLTKSELDALIDIARAQANNPLDTPLPTADDRGGQGQPEIDQVGQESDGIVDTPDEVVEGDVDQDQGAVPPETPVVNDPAVAEGVFNS